MEISLIRSGWEPDPASDIGTHDFVYSILPHKSSRKESQTIKEGYFLNNSLITAFIKSKTNAELPESASFININAENIVISAFKPSEFDNALILRVYEGAGIGTSVKFRVEFPIYKVDEVNLNETKIYSTVSCENNIFECYMEKYAIKTFKLYRFSQDHRVQFCKV